MLWYDRPLVLLPLIVLVVVVIIASLHWTMKMFSEVSHECGEDDDEDDDRDLSCLGSHLISYRELTRI